jgi:hypothetical protein
LAVVPALMLVAGSEDKASRSVSRVGGWAVENERSAFALRAHVSLREGGYISLSYEEKTSG